MLRLLVLLGAVLGLATFLVSPPSTGALPADAPDQDCLGPLRSSLARGAAEGRSRRDEQTGEWIVFPAHFNGDFNPGKFQGTSGESEFLAFLGLDELYIEHNGCFLPVRVLGGCIDFNAEDLCSPSDSDADTYPDRFETSLGSDPNNPSSTPEYALLDEQTGSHTCGDRVDNDLDGRKDNGDSGCRLTCDDFGGRERCSDSDRDGWRKYVEDMYGSDPDNRLSTPESLSVAGTCNDGVDNDLDGKTDEDDVGCGGGACIDFDDPLPPSCGPF